MIVVYKTEQEVKSFDQNWLSDASDDFIDSWLGFLEFTKSIIDQKKFRDYDSFGEELKLMRNHVTMTEKRKDIENIERVVNRARMFKDLVLRASKKLPETLTEQLGKYCLSFAYEGADQNLDCVIEYENNINNWTVQVRDDLEKLKMFVADLQEQEGTSIETYIRNYGKVIHYMALILELIPLICNCFKNWVMADEAYPRKLQDEMNRYQKSKNEIMKKMHKREEQKRDSKLQIQRAGYDVKRVQDHIQWTLSERRQCRKKELSVQDNIDVLEEEIREKEAEYLRLSHEYSRQKMSSSREMSVNIAKLESLSHDIVEMKNSAKRQKSKLNKMKIDRFDVQRDLYETKGVFEKNVRKAKRIKIRAKSEEREAGQLLEEVKILTGKINALSRIRKIKTDPMTVKRIFYEGYLPRRTVDLSDHLSEALRLTAAGVGKDWGGLYQHLPFDPPRDKSTRKHDIQVLDIGIKHQDRKSRNVALKGLEKWRRLSNNASTNALVRTLRSIEKQSVADTLERQVIAN
ncbi:hypothetical protein FSP39_012677 [Pinctada imbricata]|uniref:Death domain-containing protein n=1 Tax=Pinctada imbricata TaxID=66713 RepID=A0AA88XFH6_PINIB|nr:hypothetical protein FSP39_012677 [Pinctada imbricata]